MRSYAFAAWLQLGRPFDPGHRDRFRAVAAMHGLTTQCLEGGSMVATRGGFRAGQSSGVILGQLFANGTAKPLLAGAAWNALASKGPARFTREVWGNYIAIGVVHDRPEPIVYRGPFGDVPCFWIVHEGHMVVGSSPALLKAFGAPSPTVDWGEIACFLLATEMRREATCLEGIRELAAGSAIFATDDGPVVAPIWSPWPFAHGTAKLANPAEAAATVADAVDLAVAGRSADVERSVLLLSGGLDSSIVAAALGKAGARFASLNMVTRERSGDERAYARLVAEVTGSKLTERFRSPAALDFHDPTLCELARPSARLFRQPTLAAARELANAFGASVVFDGGGGDNLFCSLQSVAPLLDRLAVEGIGKGLWETAREIALFDDVAVCAVLRKAALRRLRGRVRYRWPIETGLLGPVAEGLAARAGTHPWLEPPVGALPGEAAHVALVLGSLALSEDDSTHDSIRTISPLVAQPVVEAVLRVPSWFWLENGRNRAITRRAFAGRLPAAVLDRHGKGTPTGFVAELIATHRRQIRELLHEGLLASHDIIDGPTVDAYLLSTEPPRDFRFARIMQFIDAERWARSWC